MSDKAPMTWDERVEAAAREMAAEQEYPQDWDSWERRTEHNRKQWRADARSVLAAAFPELSGDKPTRWIAPWESDGLMDDAARTATGQKWIGTEPMVLWSAMRDAYLGKGDGG